MPNLMFTILRSLKDLKILVFDKFQNPGRMEDMLIYATEINIHLSGTGKQVKMFIYVLEEAPYM